MKQTIKIGNSIIGEGCGVFIIAEAGINHQGDINIAKKLIDIAVEAGCDCVKLQKRDLSAIYSENTLTHVDKQQQDLQYTLSNLKKVELSEIDMVKLMEYSTDKGINFLCTPWDEKSLEFLTRLNLSAYKIGSPDMSNYRLIDAIVKINKPIIISTGMSHVYEIDALIKHLNKINAEYALLHCNSTYPAPYFDINLNFLLTLKKKGVPIVGYSSHETGMSVCLAAVGMGAKIIEKHITLDKRMIGQDHRASMVKEELVELVKQIRIVESSMGSSMRFLSRGEYINRESSSKSIVVTRDLKNGNIIQEKDLTLKSPGTGISPLKLDYFIGKKLTKDIPKDSLMLENYISKGCINNSINLNIYHKWGIVARMDDIDNLMHNNPSFVEIHPTSSDINKNEIYTKKYNVDITVHAPEYNNELLIDVSSMDEEIRRYSIDFLKKSIDYFRRIKGLFNNHDSDIMFVLHPGGMNMHKPILNISQLNMNLLKSVNELQEYGKGFKILIENHPPYPWYFGGQWHHSSFMDADEIVKFSEDTGYGIVFDIAHAALYCNLFHKNLEEYTKTILPVTKYIHIADAAGVSGEGIQIGDGTIDFKNLLKYIISKDTWILSEIWQGHKFGGEGFIIGLRNLKNIDGRL